MNFKQEYIFFKQEYAMGCYKCFSAFFVAFEQVYLEINLDLGLASKVYFAPCQTSVMEHFAKIVNGFKLLIIFAKSSIIDVW